MKIKQYRNEKKSVDNLKLLCMFDYISLRALYHILQLSQRHQFISALSNYPFYTHARHMLYNNST